MLGYLFGFNARIGRLAYVFCTLALGIGIVLLAYGVTGTIPGRGRTDVLLAQAANSGPMLIAVCAAMVINFMLQSMRIRDIGWDPVCVMVGWVALVIVDRTVASRIPEWAIGLHHTGTLIGGLISLALTLVLFVWPGGHSEEPLLRDRDADGFPRRSSAPAPATNRIARVANGEFGSRRK